MVRMEGFEDMQAPLAYDTLKLHGNKLKNKKP